MDVYGAVARMESNAKVAAERVTRQRERLRQLVEEIEQHEKRFHEKAAVKNELEDDLAKNPINESNQSTLLTAFQQFQLCENEQAKMAKNYHEIQVDCAKVYNDTRVARQTAQQLKSDYRSLQSTLDDNRKYIELLKNKLEKTQREKHQKSSELEQLNIRLRQIRTAQEEQVATMRNKQDELRALEKDTPRLQDQQVCAEESIALVSTLKSGRAVITKIRSKLRAINDLYEKHQNLQGREQINLDKLLKASCDCATKSSDKNHLATTLNKVYSSMKPDSCIEKHIQTLSAFIAKAQNFNGKTVLEVAVQVAKSHKQDQIEGAFETILKTFDDANGRALDDNEWRDLMGYFEQKEKATDATKSKAENLKGECTKLSANATVLKKKLENLKEVTSQNGN